MKGLKIDGYLIDDYIANFTHSAQLNYLEIEPVTGMLYKMVRSYTMVYSNSCYENNQC